MTIVDMRCPNSPQRLFARVRAEGRRPAIVEGNLIEFACHDCKRDLRRAGEQVSLVLHRYDLAGTLIETEVKP